MSVPIAIRADRLLDGSGGPPLPDPVVVAGETIIGVYQGTVPAGVLPEGATVLDYTGCTLLPALIDAHVHLNLPGDGTPFEQVVAENDEVLTAATASAAQDLVAGGVLTVRDCGSRGTTAFSVRRALQLGYGQGPRMLLSGPPITVTGGHTWYLGGEADGVDGVRRKVREVCKLGADWIKVIGSGGGTVNTAADQPAFTRQELAAIVEQAHRQDRRVTVHTTCAEALDDAISCGVDQIEHGLFLIDEARQQYEPELAARLAAAGIPVTSTMVVGYDVMRRIDAKPEPSANDKVLRGQRERMLADSLSQFRLMREAGVRFIAGTDAGWRYTGFNSLPSQLWLMTEAGMTGAKAIAAATGAAADVLGVSSVTGRLAPGLAADIIAVRGDPVDDIRLLSDVRLVIQAGTIRKNLGTAASKGVARRRPWPGPPLAPAAAR
jgi:imidazolonepropionase-like amidohydrolase